MRMKIACAHLREGTFHPALLPFSETRQTRRKSRILIWRIFTACVCATRCLSLFRRHTFIQFLGREDEGLNCVCAHSRRWIYDYIHGIFHAILPAKMSRNNRFIMERARPAEGSRRKCEAETREAELVLSALFAGRGKSKASLAHTHLLSRKESAPARLANLLLGACNQLRTAIFYHLPSVSRVCLAQEKTLSVCLEVDLGCE